MIRAENILFLPVELTAVLNPERYKNKDEEKPGPKSVQLSNKTELTGKNDRYEKEGK